MKFGGGYIPQDDDLRIMDPWVPVTPEKLIPAKPHPIPVNPHGNLLQGANCQQQLTGISRDVSVGASYNGMHQAVSPNGQLLRNGGHYSYDGSLAEKNQMINHFAGSFTQLLRDDSSCWNNNPMTQLLHDKAAYVASANINLSRSIDIAANTPLIPKLHPLLGNQENNTRSYLLTNQNCNSSYPSSNVMSRSLVMDFPSPVDNSRRDSNSLHWLFGNQNHSSSSSSNLFFVFSVSTNFWLKYTFIGIQNVSDHLSSSAFMSLAARFPVQSSNHQAPDKVGTNILVKEPKVRMTSPDDATKWHKDISSQSIYRQISMTLHESAENQKDSENSWTERNLDEAHSQCFEEEFVSSQDSFESSVTQGDVGIGLYPVSNSETEDPITGYRPNKIPTSISTYQQMEKAAMFQDFYRQVNGSSLLDDGSKNGYMEYSQIKARSGKINHLTGTSFTNPINLDDEVPVVPSSNNQLHMYPDSGEPEPWRFGTFSEESISSWPSTASRFNIEQDKCKNLRNEELLGSVVNSSIQQSSLWSSQEMPPMDPYASFRQHTTDQKNRSETRPSSRQNPSNYSHQREENPTMFGAAQGLPCQVQKRRAL